MQQMKRIINKNLPHKMKSIWIDGTQQILLILNPNTYKFNKSIVRSSQHLKNKILQKMLTSRIFPVKLFNF